MKREGRHDGSRNANYEGSAAAPGFAFGPVVWGKCNVCKYKFKQLPDGRIDMKDFRTHKAGHTAESLVKKKYTHGA